MNEPDGISTSTPPGLTTVYGPMTTGPHFAFADGTPVNWNIDTGDADSTDTGGVSDINDIPQLQVALLDLSVIQAFKLIQDLMTGMQDLHFKQPVPSLDNHQLYRKN